MPKGLESAGGWESFARAVEEDETAFTEMVAAAVARRTEPGERLLALIEVCVVDYDWSLWIELWSRSLREQPARALRERLDASFRGQIAELISDGVAAGEFDVGDVERTTLALATTIDSLAVEATLGDATVSPNFMFGACALLAGQLVGKKLQIAERSVDV